MKDLCQDDHAVNVLTTRGAKVSELPFDCAQNLTDSSFVWLAWNDFLAKVKPLTNGNGFREGNSYFGRNILNQEDESGEFCRIDLTTGHCVSPNVNQSQNVLATEVLVQRIPLIYDLKTRQATSWRNVTDGDMVLLTTNHLSNRKLTTQFVQKIVSYDLEREYQFDLPESLSKEVAVNVYDEAGRLNLRFDVGDAAKTLISKSVPAIKRMLPRTTIEVSVRGRNEHILSKLNADLITVFDRHDDEAIAARFSRNLLLNVSVWPLRYHSAIWPPALSVSIIIISIKSSITAPLRHPENPLNGYCRYPIISAHRNRCPGRHRGVWRVREAGHDNGDRGRRRLSGGGGGGRQLE